MTTSRQTQGLAPPRARAIVPLKALGRAKRRLASHLDPEARRDLTALMLARVVAACHEARGIDGVLVVAGDDEAGTLAADLGLDVVVEPAPTLAAALATADRLLAGAAATMVVTADLPLATGAALDAVWSAADASTAAGSADTTGDADEAGPGRAAAAAGGEAGDAGAAGENEDAFRGRAVVVAESLDGGTSALLRRPGSVIGTAFGPASAQAHLRLAAEAGVPGRRLRLPALALDVDDLAGLRAAARESAALAAWLDGRGLGSRAAAS